MMQCFTFVLSTAHHFVLLTSCKKQWFYLYSNNYIVLEIVNENELNFNRYNPVGIGTYLISINVFAKLNNIYTWPINRSKILLILHNVEKTICLCLQSLKTTRVIRYSIMWLWNSWFRRRYTKNYGWQLGITILYRSNGVLRTKEIDCS